MSDGLRALVPMAHVADVQASIDFYARLGFVAENTHRDPHGALAWAFLRRAGAQLMLARASGPVDAGMQAVLFYLYYEDVVATHRALAAEGLAVGELNYPFYCPKGEFRLHDPDGYVLLLTHT